MLLPRITTGTSRLLAALVIASVSQARPLSAQDRTQALAAPAATPSQERAHAIVDGHRVQPNTQEICRLSPRSSQCRNSEADAANDELLRDILRRSKP
jgi:hypothetical protein